MIMLKDLLTEAKYPYGCIMASIDGASQDKILELNKKLIPDDIIYDNNKHEFGRELNPHVTIKLGFTEQYSREEIKNFLKDIPPFSIKFNGISIFKNDKFDVVKLDVESDILNKLNKQFSKLPNKDEHPNYHPHCTLAYVNPEEGKQFISGNKKISDATIHKIVYSHSGKKSYYNL